MTDGSVSGHPWIFELMIGSPRDLHAREGTIGDRRVVRCQPCETSLVIGSTQSLDTLNQGVLHRRGIEIVRRRSGGGSVLVVPGEILWIDVSILRSDSLWLDDVSRSALWLGGCWAGALESMGVGEVEVAESSTCGSALGRTVCFAGLSTGEVTVAGRKVVGISQRRCREGAVFHCAAYLHWSPSEHVEALSLPDTDRSAAVRELEQAAAGVDQIVGGRLTDMGSALTDALMEVLARNFRGR